MKVEKTEQTKDADEAAENDARTSEEAEQTKGADDTGDRLKALEEANKELRDSLKAERKEARSMKAKLAEATGDTASQFAAFQEEIESLKVSNQSLTEELKASKEQVSEIQKSWDSEKAELYKGQLMEAVLEGLPPENAKLAKLALKGLAADGAVSFAKLANKDLKSRANDIRESLKNTEPTLFNSRRPSVLFGAIGQSPTQNEDWKSLKAINRVKRS